MEVQRSTFNVHPQSDAEGLSASASNREVTAFHIATNHVGDQLNWTSAVFQLVVLAPLPLLCYSNSQLLDGFRSRKTYE